MLFPTRSHLTYVAIKNMQVGLGLGNKKIFMVVNPQTEIFIVACDISKKFVNLFWSYLAVSRLM